MTFPIKKRIDTELFIDRMTALSIGDTWIRVVIHAGDQECTLRRHAVLISKKRGNERPGVNQS